MGRLQRRTKDKPMKYFDYSLLFVIIFLICFGLVMLYSTSSYNGQIKFGDSAYYVKKQLFATLLGVVAMFAIASIDYHVWIRFAGAGYVAALALCTAVIFIGKEVNGQRRWLGYGSISFQPSELAKIAIILFLAVIISKMPKQMKDFKTAFKVLLTAIPIVGVIAYNNLSTGIIILGIATVMVFVACPKYIPFVGLGAGVIAFGVVFIYMQRYRAERIMVWLNPEQYDKGYQTMQGLYAIGSGKLFGKGLGESMQKLGFLPEAQNDMIFSIVCEELGLFGAVAVILLFLLMLWRFMIIANNATDLYGSMLVVGIMTHIALQVILNIAVVTNTIPNTGVTLPFISYGGTSVCFLLAEMGLAMSVSRGIRLDG